MTDNDWLAAAFEEHRDHLRAVAYRMLGSMSDAEDAVQDTWLRLTGADTSEVRNLGGWLTTVVARVSLNMLRSRRYRHEEPVGDSWPSAAEAGARAGPGRREPGRRGGARGLGRARPARGARHAHARRAARVRAARHVRHAVLRGGGRSRTLTRRDPATGQPGPAPGAGRVQPRSGRGHRPPAGGGRRLSRRRPRRRLLGPD